MSPILSRLALALALLALAPSAGLAQPARSEIELLREEIRRLHGAGRAEKEIDLADVSGSAKVWIRTPLLVQTSHTHLFGQTLIAGQPADRRRLHAAVRRPPGDARGVRAGRCGSDVAVLHAGHHRPRTPSRGAARRRRDLGVTRPMADGGT